METKKFKPVVNSGHCCPPRPPPCPHPLPPPGPCPAPHGHIFQGCVAYINSYIDIRMRQLYLKIKKIINKIAGQYFGPWDYIILRDASHPENTYKVYIDEGCLRSKPHQVQETSDEIEDDVLDLP